MGDFPEVVQSAALFSRLELIPRQENRAFVGCPFPVCGLCDNFQQRQIRPPHMIDLDKALEQLRSRKELVDCAIAQLEGLLHPDGTNGRQNRRGRKSMGEAERRQVSSRMRSYWESRRKQFSQKSTEL